MLTNSESSSLGIIGGADGPTAVFITGSIPWEILLIAAVLIVGIVIWKRKK